MSDDKSRYREAGPWCRKASGTAYGRQCASDLRFGDVKDNLTVSILSTVTVILTAVMTALADAVCPKVHLEGSGESLLLTIF